MSEIKQKTDPKNKLKEIVLILLFLSMIVYLTYDIIMTNIFSNYYCNQEPNPKTFINKTVKNPISIYWEDNVYPGFNKEDRELMIINYLNGKNLKTMALNGDDGKIYVYSANENDYEKIIQNSTEQKDIYKKYKEYAKFVMQNEKEYSKDSMPKMNYSVTFNEVKLPSLVSKFLYSDETKVIENSTNEIVGFNRRYMRFFYKLHPDFVGRYYWHEPICGDYDYGLEQKIFSLIKYFGSLRHKKDLNTKLYLEQVNKKYIQKKRGQAPF
jgi:hypothetical protein